MLATLPGGPTGGGVDSPAPSGKPKISLRNLCIEYFNEQRNLRNVAVQNLSMDLMEHEFLCVVGPSGCGKSTLISTIAGFQTPASGEIEMDGKAITRPGADRGVVFQEYALLPWKTVRSNIALGLRLRGVPKREREVITQRFLALTNLSAAAEKFPHELSGGMKQRVAVARTLANSPQVVLMDEPFAAVDAQTRMTLQEELVKVWNESRITVLFVTHSVEEAVFLADRVIVMTPGPGRVKDTVVIDVPRDERNWTALRENRNFVNLCNQIFALVSRA